MILHFRAGLRAALVVFVAIGSAAARLRSDGRGMRTHSSAVTEGGKGDREAQRALLALSAHRHDDLPAFFKALDHSSPLAANWIRNAFEIRGRPRRYGYPSSPFAAATLEAFVRETSHRPDARRLAYEWLVKVDSASHGPADSRNAFGSQCGVSPRRRRACGWLQAAKVDPKTDKQKAIRLYREAFTGVVHEDQVKEIAAALEKLGQKVNIAAHFAFLTHFSVIGPFDNRDGIGLEAVYPSREGDSPGCRL